MAEQERKTFKWGDQEYLLDDLLKIHAAQENNFYDFARTRGQYDDNALMGLRQAITNRINAVKSGEAFEGDGVLGTDKVDNTRIQTQKKGLFRKEKYVDQDNTEWAKYYLNKLVGGLKAYKKEEKTPDNVWNLDKHGFGAYLKSLGYTPQSIFEGYDKRDASNPEAKRGFTERDNHHITHLQAWRNAAKDYDFTKDDNPHNDNLMARVDAFLKDPNAYDRVQRGALLREIGAGDYADAYTSDRWDLTKSSDQASAEARAAAEKKKAEEEAKLKATRLKEFEDYAYSQKRTSNPLYHRPFDYSTHEFNGKNANFMNWYADLNREQQSQYGTYLGRDSQKWKNAWDSYTQALRGGQAYNDKNLGMLLQGTFESQPNGFIDLGDGKYLIRESMTDSGQGTVYDPKSGYTNTVFLGDVADRHDEIKRAYQDIAYRHINNKYGTSYEDRRYVFKEGGELIPKHQYGNEVVYNWESTDSSIKPKAKANDRDLQMQKDRDRYINPDNKSEDNPDAGFTAAEMTRLGSIGADIVSMFLDPISGTAVGIGSSLANFGADWADDGFQMSDLGNLGINIGFDLLGAIPVFGDALGTGTKITRNLVKWAPRVMTSLAAYQGVKNFDGMMQSWDKMTSSGEDAKMTVQDWRNIAQSISLLTGGVRATKNKVAQHQMKKQAKVDGVLSINVRNKNGEIEQILVDGKTAEAIKNNRNNVSEVEKILNGIEGYEGKFGAGKDYEINIKQGGWQTPIGRNKDDVEGSSWDWRGFRKDGGADINNYYDFNRVRGYRSGLGYNVKGSKTLDQLHQNMVQGLNRRPVVAENMQGKMSGADIDAEFKQLLKDQGVDTQIEALTQAVQARNKSQEITRNKLTKAQEALGLNQDRVKNMAKEADLQANKALYEAELRNLPDDIVIRDAENAIAHNTSVINRNKEKRQRLSEARSENLQQMEAGMRARIKQRRADVAKMKEAKKRLEKLQAKGTIGPRQQKTLNDLPQNIKQAEKDIRTMRKDIKSARDRIINQNQRAYTRLAADTRQAKAKIATAQPVAAQRADLNKYKGKLQDVESDLAVYADVNAKNASIQQRINTLQGRLSAHAPTAAHTKAYTDLQNMLNNLRTSHTQIGGRNLSWDMDDILKQYNLDPSKVFKQGGSINVNKLNKFLNYAKG